MIPIKCRKGDFVRWITQARHTVFNHQSAITRPGFSRSIGGHQRRTCDTARTSHKYTLVNVVELFCFTADGDF